MVERWHWTLFTFGDDSSMVASFRKLKAVMVGLKLRRLRNPASWFSWRTLWLFLPRFNHWFLPMRKCFWWHTSNIKRNILVLYKNYILITQVETFSEYSPVLFHGYSFTTFIDMNLRFAVLLCIGSHWFPFVWIFFKQWHTVNQRGSN